MNFATGKSSNTKKFPSQYLCLLDLFEYLFLEIQEVDSEKVNLGFLQLRPMAI